MKLATLVFLFITVLGTLGTKSTYQPKLSPTLTTKDKMQKTHLGNAILNMIQLGNTVEADFDDLYEALNLLKENLVSRKNNEQVEFQEDGETHRREVSRLSRLINQYNAAIITFQDELSALKSEEEALNDKLRNQNGQLSSAEGQLENENQLLESLADSFEQEQLDYSEAINLLGEAIGKLQEAQNSGGQGFSSFIESNRVGLNDLNKRINNSFSKLKGSSSFNKSVNLFFSQLTTGQPNNATLAKAIDALQGLQQFYQDGLAALTANYQQTVDEHNGLITQIQIQIGELKNVTIPKTEVEIQANAEAQEIRNSQLVKASSNANIEQGNLDAENESWEQRVELHQQLMPQFDEEFAIVEQAEALLRQQQN